MSEDARRRSLGRGLSALFESERAPASESAVQRAFKIIPIELLTPSPLQPPEVSSVSPPLDVPRYTR